jgi:hypothetical protein
MRVHNRLRGYDATELDRPVPGMLQALHDLLEPRRDVRPPAHTAENLPANQTFRELFDALPFEMAASSEVLTRFAWRALKQILEQYGPRQEILVDLIDPTALLQPALGLRLGRPCSEDRGKF